MTKFFKRISDLKPWQKTLRTHNYTMPYQKKRAIKNINSSILKLHELWLVNSILPLSLFFKESFPYHLYDICKKVNNSYLIPSKLCIVPTFTKSAILISSTSSGERFFFLNLFVVNTIPFFLFWVISINYQFLSLTFYFPWFLSYSL